MLAANIPVYWPLCLIVLSNVVYNLTSKAIPANASPWAVLVTTYLVSAFLSLVAYFIFEENKNFMYSVQKVNWTGFVLGLSMVGLEIGYIFIYRTGWKLSVASLPANMLLAVILLLLGMVLYHEHINLKQGLGMLLCVMGCALLMVEHQIPETTDIWKPGN